MSTFSTAKSLPNSPNFDNLKKRAKGLLREVLANQPAARAGELVKAVLLKRYATRSA